MKIQSGLCQKARLGLSLQTFRTRNLGSLQDLISFSLNVLNFNILHLRTSKSELESQQNTMTATVNVC